MDLYVILFVKSYELPTLFFLWGKQSPLLPNWRIHISLLFFLKLNVRVVSSDHSGVGKSLDVLRLAEEVAALPNNRLVVKTMEEENEEPPLLRVTIPFHDKHAQIADVVGFFLPHALPSDLPLSRIFHLDRSSAVRFSLKRIFSTHYSFAN